jgi:uncharacterized damage-inducible protein DinB
LSESERIADQIRRSLHGEAWHGPSVFEAVRDVSWQVAAERPVRGAHSIWELVLHLIVWHEVALKRLAGEAFDPTPDQDWPDAPDATAAAWAHTTEALESAASALIAAVAKLSDEALEADAPGRDHSVYVMLQGVAQHNAYHAGQIVILSKR